MLDRLPAAVPLNDHIRKLPRFLKVAIMATHPIQYQVPWFRALAANEMLSVQVYFSMLPDQQQQGIGFGVNFKWDIPLFEGYRWSALKNVARTPGLGRFFGTSTPGIHAALAADRPDAMIVTGWQSFSLLQGIWACLRLGIPIIIRAESNALRTRPWWVRMLHRMLLSRFDGFLSIGKANRDFYLRNGVSPSRIFDCHYFVDNQRIRSQMEEFSGRRADWRAAWGISTQSVCFVFAGKLQEKKRVMDLLAALGIARSDFPHLHLLVVGSGELMEAARSQVAEERLPVTFAGFLNQTEMAKAYAAGDCLVLPSDYGETWGLVVNEAMVCGLPAIVSDRVGCGPDLVSDGVTGAIFPFGDTHALAACLVRIAVDPALRASMGRQARERIAGYSVEHATQGTLQALDATVGGGNVHAN